MKKFEELKKGDFIYYYEINDWNGPSEVGKYQLKADPIRDYYTSQGVVEVGVEISSPYGTSDVSGIIAIKFSCGDSQETINLGDYGNVWNYGDELYRFMTDLDSIKIDRDNYIRKLISRHEESIISLMKLCN